MFALLGKEEEIISETKPLAINIADLKYKGNTKITSKDTDCRMINFKIEVVCEGKGKLSTDIPFKIFHTGIKFTFIGNVCIPAMNENFTANYRTSTKPGKGATMGIEANKIVIKGPAIITGNISMAINDNASVFEIDSSKSDPLILLLTSNGFKYFSGKGTFKLPSGKLYEYNESSKAPKNQ